MSNREGVKEGELSASEEALQEHVTSSETHTGRRGGVVVVFRLCYIALVRVLL